MAMAKTSRELKTTLDWARKYIAFGLPVLPCYRVKPDGDCTCPPNSKERRKNGSCKTPGKHPVPRLVPNGALSASTELDQIKKWFVNDGEYNIAVATGKIRQGNLMVVDLDVTKGKDGPATWEALQQEIGETFPDTLSQTTGSGGRQLFWWTDAEVSMSSETKLGSGIDIRGKSGYVVVPPSANKYGPYEWDNWGALLVIQSAPKGLVDRAQHGKSPASPVVTARRAAPTPLTQAGPVCADDPHDQLTLAQVQELLRAIPPDERDTWMMFGHVIKTIGKWIGGEQQAFEVWDAWAQKGEGYGGLTDQQYQWDSFIKPTLHPIGLLKKHARERGWTPSTEFQKEDRSWRKEASRKLLDALPDNAEPDEAEALFKVLSRLPELSRDAFVKEICERFKWRVPSVRGEIAKHQKQRTLDAGDDTEMDYGMLVARRVLAKHYADGKHLIRGSDRFFWKYNGRHWEPIDNGDEMIGRQCTEEIDLLGPMRLAKATVKNHAVDLLKSLRALDGDPLRLLEPPRPVINCQNGELWLDKEGNVTLKEHSPESYLRFCLSISYDPDAACPKFDDAVLEVFQKSPEPEEMRRHLYEMFGYSIQPERDIKQFWILEGTGDNGKTGIVDTQEKMIGDDGVFTLPIAQVDDVYNKSKLKQKLLLRDNDVDYMTVLPDGILKQLSENARIVGRDPYGKPKQFVNCTLPILLCNKYPLCRDLSPGVLVRVHVIPFRHRFIKGKDMKPGLFKEIWQSELPGVLNRAIEGLQRLRKRDGYLEPKDCITAREEFTRQANPLPRFLASGSCATSLEAVRERIKNRYIILDGFLPHNGQAQFQRSQDENMALEIARAEKDGLRQSMTDFYTFFWQWCRNEGIQRGMLRKMDVENHLINLGYEITIVHHQKWVEGVIAFDPGDHRPENAM